MSACEKCWADAYARMIGLMDGRSQTEHYGDLLRERKDKPCTPQQQRGWSSHDCPEGIVGCALPKGHTHTTTGPWEATND